MFLAIERVRKQSYYPPRTLPFQGMPDDMSLLYIPGKLPLQNGCYHILWLSGPSHGLIVSPYKIFQFDKGLEPIHRGQL